MPSAPSARSSASRASSALTWAGSAGRCQAGSEMRGHERAQAGVGRQSGHRLHPGQRPGGGEAVVDRPALLRGPAVRLGHRGDAGLELQRGGHPVQGLQPQAAQVADVAVQVDEPGRHHLAGHVHVAPATGPSGPSRRPRSGRPPRPRRAPRPGPIRDRSPGRHAVPGPTRLPKPPPHQCAPQPASLARPARGGARGGRAGDDERADTPHRYPPRVSSWSRTAARRRAPRRPPRCSPPCSG